MFEIRSWNKVQDTNSSPSAPAHFLSETTFRPGLPWSSSGRNEQNEISLTKTRAILVETSSLTKSVLVLRERNWYYDNPARENLFKVQDVKKKTPACQTWTILGTKRWISIEQRKISRIANTFWRKDNWEEVCQGISRSKVQGKKNCKNEHRETANFIYNFVQKTNATKQLFFLMGYYTTFATELFRTVFTRSLVWKWT